MFFDESIKIDTQKLPRILRNDYNLLQQYYHENRETEFILYVDSVEATIKACFIDGSITKQQQVDLFHVIGIYV